MAGLAEEKNIDEYTSLGMGYSFTPVAIKTSEATGKRSFTFVKELGYRVRQCTSVVKERACLLQRLSVAVQRGNMASVLGSVRGRSGPDLFWV